MSLEDEIRRQKDHRDTEEARRVARDLAAYDSICGWLDVLSIEFATSAKRRGLQSTLSVASGRWFSRRQREGWKVAALSSNSDGWPTCIWRVYKDGSWDWQYVGSTESFRKQLAERTVYFDWQQALKNTTKQTLRDAAATHINELEKHQMRRR